MAERFDMTFSPRDTLEARRALLIHSDAKQQIPLPIFIETLGDEIVKARTAGQSDEQIAHSISIAVGRVIATADITKYFEERPNGGGLGIKPLPGRIP